MKPIKQQIEDLESQLTGDMFADMDLKEKIHNLQMEEKGVSCNLDNVEGCSSCGS